MRIYVINLFFLDARLLNSVIHTGDRADSIGMRRRYMVTVRTVREAKQPGLDLGASRFRMCFRFQQDGTAAFPKDKTVSCLVKRTAGRLSLFVLSAWAEARPATTTGQRLASAPTAKTASASPAKRSMAAVEMASAPEEHAVLTVRLGP